MFRVFTSVLRYLFEQKERKKKKKKKEKELRETWRNDPPFIEPSTVEAGFILNMKSL